LKNFSRYLAVLMLAVITFTGNIPTSAQEPNTDTLLNVSYDPTREFYQAYNTLFAKYWKKISGHDLIVHQSHGGSGAQARAVIEGLDADVVTLGVQSDIDAIANTTTLLPENWQSRLPNNSSPYTSTIVFLVRKGNPKHIHDWNDLIAPGVAVITPNPKTSAGARWEFLAAYAYALKQNHNDDTKARTFISSLYHNVEALDSGARAATTTFTERGTGDVLITWENEAMHTLSKPHGRDYRLIVPSLSILAQPPVARLDANVEKHGTTRLAQEYLTYLYSKPAQRLACSFGYRPTDTSVSCNVHFAQLSMVTIRFFGGWKAAQKRFFNEDGVFDQIYQPH
jgi:sulfate/thiosulfate transport system substrate-binding protein